MGLWTQHQGLTPVPDRLVEALDRVLADLQQPTVVALQLGTDPVGRHLWICEPGGFRAGFPLDDTEGPTFLVRFADYLQEQVFPETSEAWGQARPNCVGHTHPASPLVIEDAAWWVCPVDGRKLSLIGHFQHPAPALPP